MDAKKIVWLNHAGFLLSYKGTTIVCDPWLFGSAFNNGWDLLVPSKFTVADFADVDYVWFSHEHPDHFAPPVLNAIPAAIRAKITVLFQKTYDQKVLSYCRKLGFKCRELKNARWEEIGRGIKVMCGKVPFFDSWLLMDLDGYRIFNVNDCVVDGEGVAGDIVKLTGRVDVLLTQFSYANWIGDVGDTAARQKAAKEKLSRVKMQIEVFRPDYVVPFASFVYFSHRENSYLNDAINRIDDVCRFLEREASAKTVVLFPGDEWEIGAPRSNDASLAAYAKHYELAQKPLHASQAVNYEELEKLAREYVQRLKKKNNRLLLYLLSRKGIGVFKPLRIHLTDLNKRVELDIWKGLRPLRRGDLGDVDIATDAENIAFTCKHDWGADTLGINGRLRGSMKSFQRVLRTLSVGTLNNTGRKLGWRLPFDRFLLKRAINVFFQEPSYFK